MQGQRCPGLRGQFAVFCTPKIFVTIIPKDPCTYIVYSWALKHYVGTPLRPKYIPYRYMDPVGILDPKPLV